MPNPSDRGGNPQFDNLCAMCVPIFDGSVKWKEDTMQPFHDIYSLSRSADSSCHTCNLFLGEIRPKAMEKLQRDLDVSAVTSSQQLKVGVTGSRPWILKLLARSVTLHVSESFGRGPNSYLVLGRLLIQSAEDDYTSENRSTEHWNCSSSTIAQINRWLRECITSHRRCFDVQSIAANPKVLPTRLLEMRPATQGNCIKLVGTRNLPKGTPYATLSHCWGGQCDTLLTVENLQGFESGDLLNSMPKTFQDACKVTVRLGLRYLWIDALCIMQNSVDDLDWKQEASIMGDVYANSYVTLAATASIDSKGGLLQQRSPLTVYPCRLRTNWQHLDPLRVVVSRLGLGQEMDLLPLGTRAWAFQEWLLSKRLVHFTKHEVRWECHCLAATQVYPTGLDEEDLDNLYFDTPTKNIIARIRDHAESPPILWQRIREEYSSKALTKASDKLAAFSGIAKMVFKALKSSDNEYLAGMWKPHLLTELLWERQGDDEAPYEPDLYIAPTWSWASLNGAFGGADDIRSYLGLDGRIEGQWHGEVLDAQVTPVDDVFGPVKAGGLTLRTWLCQLEICSPEERTSRVITAERDWSISIINGTAVSYSGLISIDHPSPEMRRLSVLLSFHFVPIRSVFCKDERRRVSLEGLLLQMTGKSRGQYYRVGVLRLLIQDDREDRALMQFWQQDKIDPAHYLQSSSQEVKAIEII